MPDEETKKALLEALDNDIDEFSGWHKHSQQSVQPTLLDAPVCNCPAKDVVHYKTCPAAKTQSG